MLFCYYVFKIGTLSPQKLLRIKKRLYICAINKIEY